ncbi:MAG: 1-acyl-sn-glycerol-3-phosphate acyltransferase [Candidatus Omnitrophica bacterium]|nr:1-acyl-sn-glycerol-3-phosphate acyltransferase [Candidatus Omnitrophota bacterium]
MWYWIFRIFSLIILKIFFRLKVEGIHNLPCKTNFIVVANHTSFLDPLVIAAAIPKKIHCIVSRTLFRIPLLKWALQRLEVVPTGSSSEEAIALLNENKIVGLFPEGRCSRDGRLREFRRGVALLGFKTGLPIVPCAILGTYQALPVQAKIPKLFSIKVKIGKPIVLLKEFEEVLDDMLLQSGIFRIRNTIQEMLNAV